MNRALELSAEGALVLSIVTVVFFVAFLGLVVSLFVSRRKRAAHETIAELPLAADDGALPRRETNRSLNVSGSAHEK